MIIWLLNPATIVDVKYVMSSVLDVNMIENWKSKLNVNMDEIRLMFKYL